MLLQALILSAIKKLLCMLGM